MALCFTSRHSVFSLKNGGGGPGYKKHEGGAVRLLDECKEWVVSSLNNLELTCQRVKAIIFSHQKKKKKTIYEGNKQQKQNNILKNAFTSLGSVQRFLSPNSYMCFIKAPNYYHASFSQWQIKIQTQNSKHMLKEHKILWSCSWRSSCCPIKESFFCFLDFFKRGGWRRGEREGKRTMQRKSFY